MGKTDDKGAYVSCKHCPECGAICADNADRCQVCEARRQGAAVSPGRCWGAAFLSVVWCGGGQFSKGERWKGFLLLPVNLLFYPATLFSLIALGDYDRPGAASKALPLYGVLLCVLAPFWAWGIVDALRPRKN